MSKSSLSYIIRKCYKKKWVLRNFIYTIFFNFRYLPLKQAVLLPIWLYKPSCCGKGRIVIESNRVFPGMIELGSNQVMLYSNSGVRIQLDGTIVFHGRTVIGNNSALSIGKKGTLDIGDDFRCFSTLRLVCYNKITIGRKCRVGWDCLVTDTDFHRLKKCGGGYTKGYGEIKIGNYNWIGSKCVVLKKTQTSDYTTIQAGCCLNKKYDAPPYSILGSNNEIVAKRLGFWLDPDDDVIQYVE